MVSSDFRTEARRKLSGKWGKAISIFIAYSFIFFVMGFVEGLFPEAIQSLLSLAVAVIEVPLAFGFIISLLKLFNEEDVKAFDFLGSGFSNFKKSWGVSLNILLKMLVPVILLIVSYVLVASGMTFLAVSSGIFATTSSSTSSVGIILSVLGFILLVVSWIWAITKSYYYQLAYFVAAENPELTGKQAVLKSEELMKNNRAKLFWLQLSFVGWAILCVFTFGIGFLWLMPYMQFAIISFYKHLSGNTQAPAETPTEE